MSTPDTKRIFFALYPEGDVRAALAAEGMKQAKRYGGRAMRPDTLHFTLLFLGEVPADMVRDVFDCGDAVSCPAFDLTIDAHSSFRSNKVAWLGCTETPPELIELERQLGENLLKRGYRRSIDFKPHLTVARDCRHFPPAGPLEEKIHWHVNEFALIHSEPLKGPRYSLMEYWPLSPAA